MLTTREEWLQQAIYKFAPMFTALGRPLPDKIRVACGFTSHGTRGGTKRIGECWDASRSDDRAFEILIVPTKDDPATVLSILAHELCHAAVGLKAGHRGEFPRLARGLKLEGPLTATTGGKDFLALAAPILDALGPYPHARLDTSTRKKQSTRMLKAICPECAYTVRLTAKWLSVAVPKCPVHDIEMDT